MWQSNIQYPDYFVLWTLWQCDRATVSTKIFQRCVLSDNVTLWQSTPRFFWGACSVTMWQCDNPHQDFSELCTQWQCDTATIHTKMFLRMYSVTMWQSDNEYLDYSWAVYSVTIWQSNTDMRCTGDRQAFDRAAVWQYTFAMGMKVKWWPSVHWTWCLCRGFGPFFRACIQ